MEGFGRRDSSKQRRLRDVLAPRNRHAQDGASPIMDEKIPRIFMQFKFKFTDNSLVSILDVVLRGRLVGTSPALCSPNPNVLIIPEVSNMAGSGTQLGIGCVLLGNAGGR